MSKKSKKEIAREEPSKVPKYAIEQEMKEAEHEDGQPIKPKKEKKKSSIVALKHKRVLENVMGKNSGKKRKSLYQAMIDEGYSPEYARNGHLKGTKSWDKLVEERLGDDKLSNIHRQLMVAKKLDYMLFTHEVKDEDVYELLESVGCVAKKIVHGIQGTHVWFWSSDNKTRKDALELAYKIRSKMSPEKFEIEQGGIRAMSDADLAALIKQQKNRFLKRD